jgi:plasmid stabilization system protein ParE
MNMLVVFGPEADEDVEAAMFWYHERSPGLENRFMRELETALRYVRERPRSFPLIAEDIRQISMARFPYVIVYSVHRAHVEVIRVFHTKQDGVNKLPIR